MTDRMDRTKLMYAVIDKDINLIKNLIKRCDVNKQDRKGWTALHFAAQEYHCGIVKLLLEHGASIDIEDANGNTPLWQAVFNATDKGGDVIRLMLKYKANKQRKNKSGVSPYDLAKTISNDNVVQYLE